MGAVDKGAKVIRGSVKATRGEDIDPIITPAEFAREIRNWHHLNHRDPDSDELRELFHCRAPCPFPSERADVHLVDDLAGQLYSFPLLIAPLEGVWINHAGWPVRSTRLKTRSWIGVKCLRIVDPEPIESAGTDFDFAAEIAVTFRSERVKGPICFVLEAAFRNQINSVCFGSPDPKVSSAGS